MNTPTKLWALYAAFAFQWVICLSGCSTGTTQNDIGKNLPKNESLTTASSTLASPRISLKDITKRANYICRATITGVRSAREQYDPQVNMVMSYVNINISKVYKGEPGRNMVFRAFGGELDGRPYYPSHFPQFHSGEDVILFLGDFNGGVFTVAHEAGKYTIVDGRILEIGKTIEEFENEIMSSLQ